MSRGQRKNNLRDMSGEQRMEEDIREVFKRKLDEVKDEEDFEFTIELNKPSDVPYTESEDKDI
jgi:hypothetical protein